MVFVGDLALDDMRIREYLESVRNSLLDTTMGEGKRFNSTWDVEERGVSILASRMAQGFNT